MVIFLGRMKMHYQGKERGKSMEGNAKKPYIDEWRKEVLAVRMRVSKVYLGT